MEITNVHMNSPIELRFTLVDGERETVRMVFLRMDSAADPVYVTKKIAENLTRYFEMKAAGFPHDYNSETHVTGILRDASRYGCD